jgi:hypothetical protein
MARARLGFAQENPKKKKKNGVDCTKDGGCYFGATFDFFTLKISFLF